MDGNIRELITEYFNKEVKVLSETNEDEEFLQFVFECSISRQEEIEEFLKFYMCETNETLKVKVKKADKERSIYKINSTYRCHFDTRHERTRDAESILKKNPSKRFRNTVCPFQMTFKITKCPTHPELPCKVIIDNEHNHSVNSLEALSFKMIPDELKDEIKILFENGLVASQAYKEFLKGLKLRCEDQISFHLSKADRSKCPRRRDFNSLYLKYCQEYFGGKNGAEMFEKLEERIKHFEETIEGIKIAYQLYSEEDNTALILVILTPLMIRVHEMVREASEIVFVDSTSNLDEHNLRFFLLVTHSVAGALPLGIIITSDEREETIMNALTLFKSILPDKAFYNSPNGPDVFMTDNCEELRNSLHRIWPDSCLLLCIFHILQQVWRWLHDKNHGISQNDRVEIMQMFRRIVYAQTIAEFENATTMLLDSNVMSKYEACLSYFDELFTICKSWARCFRTTSLIRGSHTNNYVEAQFLVIKDSILRRQRQFNINMLLDKLMDEFEDHYKNRLLSIADGTFDGVYSQRFKQVKLKKIPESYAVDENVEEVAVDLFRVKSKSDETVTYVVDMSLGVCECVAGSDGSPCWHQFLLWKNHFATSGNFLPKFDKFERKRFAEIAMGESLDISLYESIHMTHVTDHNHYEIQPVPIANKDENDNQPKPEREVCASVIDDRKDVAINQFELFSAQLNEHIQKGDTEFNKAVIKFTKRFESMSKNQRISALQSFGSTFFGRRRSKIKVQPTAVSRRKSGIGSRQKQSNVKHRSLPNRTISSKRKHNISQAIKQNVPSAKKSGGQSMVSNTKHFKQRKT